MPFWTRIVSKNSVAEAEEPGSVVFTIWAACDGVKALVYKCVKLPSAFHTSFRTQTPMGGMTVCETVFAQPEFVNLFHSLSVVISTNVGQVLTG